MSKKLGYLLILGGVLVITGCSKKLNQFQSDYFTVNPSPLEVVGENVPATVTGRVPSKFFVKNAEVTVTPYLEFDGTEVASTSYTFQGEKVRGNNQVVSYDNGGTITIPVMYKYQEEMASSDLTLAFDVVQGKKQYALPRVKVADGVVATATIADAANVVPAIVPDKFQRIINERYAADIKFLINQANIRDSELRSEALQGFNDDVAAASADTSRVIKEINISSYASPDGSIDFNTKLAENREKNTSAYLEKQLKKNDIADFGELTSQFTAEDWDGFQKLVSESDIQDKDLILSVLSMYQDPEQREAEIRNLSSVFDQLAEEILPQLRYSRLTASVDVIGKSDEEIQAYYASSPEALTVDELLYCATLTDDPAKKLEIYDTAAKIYPDDYRTINNVAVYQYVEQDYDAAKANFEQALKMEPASSEVKMNLGLIALVEGNYPQANTYLGAAAGVEGLDEAMGVYYLKLGDNAAAVRAFGDTNSTNSAVAQILTKDYSKANETLPAIATPDATTYYLMAIVGARTNNEEMVKSNLTQAIALDSSLAAKAQTDLEFAAFDISGL